MSHLLRCVTLIGALVLVFAAPAAHAGDVDFERDIRPILSRRCYRCHGSRKQESSLRLDRRATALQGGEHGALLVPGKSERSLLLRVVRGKVDDISRMPRRAKPLAAAEIELLRRWIDQGARWPEEARPGESRRKTDHWAFRAPVRPPFPDVERRDWLRNPIDHFVLARLEDEGLAPSPEADRTTLLRRLSLDLVGLPPATEDIDAFLADSRPGAHEALVERLLASPHHGERWGRHWLDAARYADSDGYEKDKPRSVWFYRDWVIDAINRDLPYDRFVTEQIAGDLLPGATQEQIVATGFLRNSMINEEGGVDPEQFRMEAMFDRMDAIGKSVLGLTIQCAQCHDHKYDPLTQEEYYRIFAYLNNDHEANVSVYTPGEQRERSKLFREIRAIEAELQRRHPDWAERLARWEEEARKDPPEWIVLRPEVEEISTGGQKYLPLPDGSFLAQSYAPTKHRVRMTARIDLERVAAFRLELLTDPNLPRGGPGRSILGTCALTEFEVSAAPAAEPGKAKKVKIARASSDLELPERPLDAIFDDRSGRRRVTGPVAFAIDGKDDTAWGSDAGPGRRNQPRKAVFTAETPVAHPGGMILTFHLKQNHGGWNSDDNQNHNLGRFRLSVTADPHAAADPLAVVVRRILAVPREERSPAQSAAVFSHFRKSVPEWREANERIEAIWRRHPEGSTQLVLEARDEPRGTRILQRGDFLRPGRPATAGTPAFLHSLPPDAPPTRLTFARWLVDRRSPTTARAIVNRTWQSYFGRGLVATSEDLGTQSEAPSHPALLDWLAVELMDRGWSLKALQRLLVTSATYRQSSRVTPELQRRDPYNRLLARGPRLRVEAEIVRDIALTASGLLHRKIGGRSVHPPLPAFMLLPPVSYGPKVWREEKGAERYRRGLYTFRYRSLPYPALETFDAPNGDFSCVRRDRSNTPLQALVTLNEPLFVECARAMARRTLDEKTGGDSERLTHAFRLAVGRRPTDAETAALLELREKSATRFAGDPQGAAALAGLAASGEAELPRGATRAGLAAWTVVCRVLLNLDETITKE
ncbi:MAG: PSD1 and planctomycete cytochrome C domain-containing protein [Planctomycetota bacterium]|nr:PSD1 and planctomycete cytochrome C domain-containing protein [Planctomycetota bacterium]